MYASVITDQIDEDLETALRIAKLYGYTHVELHNVFGKSIEECSLKEINTIRTLLNTYDMKVSCIASTVFFLCPLMEQDTVSLFNPAFHAIEGDASTHLRYLKNACRIAKKLNCPRVRIFPFRFPDNRPPYYGTQEHIARIMKNVRQAVRIAEEEHVTLVLENCPYSHLPKGHMSIQVVKAIKSDYLKLLWDPANSYRAYKENVPPEYLTFSLEEELQYIYPWIDHIHIKDYAYDEALAKPFRHVAFDMGDIDFMMIFSNLRKYGYENAVSLEAETEYNETLESMKRMQDWISLADPA